MKQTLCKIEHHNPEFFKEVVEQLATLDQSVLNLGTVGKDEIIGSVDRYAKQRMVHVLNSSTNLLDRDDRVGVEIETPNSTIGMVLYKNACQIVMSTDKDIKRSSI